MKRLLLIPTMALSVSCFSVEHVDTREKSTDRTSTAKREASASLDTDLKGFTPKSIMGWTSKEDDGHRLFITVSTQQVDQEELSCSFDPDKAKEEMRKNISVSVILAGANLDAKGLPKASTYKLAQKSFSDFSVLVANKSETQTAMTSGEVEFVKRPQSAEDNFEIRLDVKDGDAYVKGVFKGRLIKLPDCSETEVADESGRPKASINPDQYEFVHACIAPADPDNADQNMGCIEYHIKKGSQFVIPECDSEWTQSSDPCTTEGLKSTCRFSSLNSYAKTFNYIENNLPGSAADPKYICDAANGSFEKF